MDIIWVRFVVAGIGAVSLYLGYKLFCDVSQQTRRVSSLTAGALLALFGLGLLFAEARGIAATTNHSHAGRYDNRPAEQGSYAAPRLHHPAWVERTS